MWVELERSRYNISHLIVTAVRTKAAGFMGVCQRHDQIMSSIHPKKICLPPRPAGLIARNPSRPPAGQPNSPTIVDKYVEEVSTRTGEEWAKPTRAQQRCSRTAPLFAQSRNSGSAPWKRRFYFPETGIGRLHGKVKRPLAKINEENFYHKLKINIIICSTYTISYK